MTTSYKLTLIVSSLLYLASFIKHNMSTTSRPQLAHIYNRTSAARPSCSLCGKRRSSRYMTQVAAQGHLPCKPNICSRRGCVQRAQEIASVDNVRPLVVEVHHYHYFKENSDIDAKPFAKPHRDRNLPAELPGNPLILSEHGRVYHEKSWCEENLPFVRKDLKPSQLVKRVG